jgi:2-C-methyl-D-erythritol 4-phosphate cytidylyltransferase
MYLLIPAAGMGKRMGSDLNKLLLTLHGKPLLAWTLLACHGIQGNYLDWDYGTTGRL